MKRDYVIVCNRYKGLDNGLLFWGRLTKDGEERSFGGYTSNFNYCEKYTYSELKKSSYRFPFFNEEVDLDNYRTVDDFFIKIDELKNLGYIPVLIYTRG